MCKVFCQIFFCCYSSPNIKNNYDEEIKDYEISDEKIKDDEIKDVQLKPIQKIKCVKKPKRPPPISIPIYKSKRPPPIDTNIRYVSPDNKIVL